MARSKSTSSQRPRLRVVAENPTANRRLMPIGELDARLKEIDRILKRGSADPRNGDAQVRQSLERQRELIRCEMAARPFNPAEARRCEQQLRWLMRATSLRLNSLHLNTVQKPAGWRAWLSDKADQWFFHPPTARA